MQSGSPRRFSAASRDAPSSLDFLHDFLPLDVPGTDGDNHSVIRLTKKSAADEAGPKPPYPTRMSTWMKTYRSCNKTGSNGSTRSLKPFPRLPHRNRAQVVRRVCDALQATYNDPRHGNPRDPLDDLVYVILSNKTGPIVARNVYDRLRAEFPQWAWILSEPRAKLKRRIRPAGLSEVKSRHIRGALLKIKRDFGDCDLTSLRGMQMHKAHAYLVSLPGVSDKVAKCVLMYTCDAKVLPVDSHVHRIATRLGWTQRKRADQCHDELEALVLPDRRKAFHVNCLAHGRRCCRPLKPDCEHCCIRRHCRFVAGQK